ncbi:MAG: glycerol-3-phosphate acyltransferase [Candidatus Aminicenantaceae bacterium]
MTPAKWGLILFGSYLLGSISPSYILGKLLKNINIRDEGEKNAGTVNAYHLLGFWPAVVTALFDLSKGLLAMYLAHILGASPVLIHLTGFAVIFGHIFPFCCLFMCSPV